MTSGRCSGRGRQGRGARTLRRRQPRAQRGTSCCAVTGASSAALRGGEMFRLLAFFHEPSSHVELTVQYRMPSVLADNIRRDKAKHADWPLYFDFQYTDCSSNDINRELHTRREEFERMWAQEALSGRGDDGGDSDVGAPLRPAAAVAGGRDCGRGRGRSGQGRGRLLWSTVEPETNEDGNQRRQMCLSPFLKFIDHDFDTFPSDKAKENPHVRSLLAWFSF